jgi:hypothetical protein
MTETVTLIKQPSGKRYEGIEASVQSEKIFIDDADLPVEEGDKIEHELPNGLKERYVVMDRGYHGGMRGIPAGYQIEVRKEGRPTESNESTKNVTYNLHGDNSRVNVSSVDASTNINNEEANRLFKDLRNKLKEEVENREEREELLNKVDELEEAAGSDRFSDKYQEFMAMAADHMGVVSPFASALSQLL